MKINELIDPIIGLIAYFGRMKVAKIKINRLKIVLAEREVTQKMLAEKVGMMPNSITRICNNDSQPPLLKLREIAIVLDVDIRELLIPTKPTPKESLQIPVAPTT
jgi:transcriptional regulator with XRE-family HTH domain